MAIIRFIRLILLISIAVCTYLTADFISNYFTTITPTTELISPIPATERLAVQEIKTAAFDAGLYQAVDSALEGTRGTYAIVIKDMETGQTYTRLANRKFMSASLYKLWIMAVVYQQINQGLLTEEKPLSANVKTLNRQFGLSDEIAERTEGGVSGSVLTLLTRMITISDNYSALLLSSTVKQANTRKFLSDYTLTSSSISSPPQTTAGDIAHYYETLYKGQLVDKDSSDKMLGLLKQQRLNDRIPKYLPEGTVVAHKTGELDSVKHDAGIVYTPKGDYIFVALSESTNPLQAAERIALVSKNVYEYFEKRK